MKDVLHLVSLHDIRHTRKYSLNCMASLKNIPGSCVSFVIQTVIFKCPFQGTLYFA